MSTENLLEHIKALPPDEQRSLVNHLLDHLFLEQDTKDDDHDTDFYNLDIF
ncbi:hypothetical protein [Desulforamulus reducens]|uniref:hypothetical protein n=1 Tax=Desulforamulus reducens TaxID=59610 RepID=UPI0002F8865A|nr:hypothetical protein [Desulforamulus reducens]